MRIGRLVSTATAIVGVAACTALVIGMSRADAGSNDDAAGDAGPAPSVVAYPTQTSFVPAVLGTSAVPVVPSTRAHSSPARPQTSPSSHPSTHAAPPKPAAPAPATTAQRRTAQPPVTPTGHPVAPKKTTPKAAPKKAATTSGGVALPLRYDTHKSTRVITVVASSTASTTAHLQAWTKVSRGHWKKYGPQITAHIGSQGMSTHPSESRSATPIGPFTLTRAFGHNSDPGTALPYIHTNPADWWISQSGPLYNTHQHCSSHCPFSLGNPNEHLYYETPFYNYAVVIDYNTANAGPVRQGAGSAFFLHVTDGHATAGCVAIPQSNLVTIMRWLTPSAHPRILIGVA